MTKPHGSAIEEGLSAGKVPSGTGETVVKSIVGAFDGGAIWN
jgi:hypothetical protein